jgi:hypothetical protein
MYESEVITSILKHSPSFDFLIFLYISFPQLPQSQSTFCYHCSTRLSLLLLFLSAIRTEVCWTRGQGAVKFLKRGQSWGNQDSPGKTREN